MTAIASLTIQKMPLGQINPAEYNPRNRLQPGSREYEELKRSIQTFGYVDPLVWNRTTGNLVGGHQRYYILRDLGETEVDVSVVELDPVREKALNLALNKISGEWNLAQLQMVVDSIAQEDASLLAATGFADNEVAEMVRLSEIESATDFLGVDEPGLAPRASVGAPELKDDHPHRTGTQYFQLQIVLDEEQRNVYYDAINKAKRLHGLDSTMDALVAICQEYLAKEVAA